MAAIPPDHGTIAATELRVSTAGWRNHLAVRDVLRVDAELRAGYAAVEGLLAASVDDIDLYVAGKSDVLSRVLRRGGLTDAEVREIEVSNRVPGPTGR